MITNPYEVEDRIISRNITHFGQAQGTPCTTCKLTDVLGYTGVSKQASKIIQGDDIEAFLTTIGTGEAQILRQLNDGNNTEQISTAITQK